MNTLCEPTMHQLTGRIKNLETYRMDRGTNHAEPNTLSEYHYADDTDNHKVWRGIEPVLACARTVTSNRHVQGKYRRVQKHVAVTPANRCVFLSRRA